MLDRLRRSAAPADPTAAQLDLAAKQLKEIRRRLAALAEGAARAEADLARWRAGPPAPRTPDAHKMAALLASLGNCVLPQTI